jgi:hypothetical protein
MSKSEGRGFERNLAFFCHNVPLWFGRLQRIHYNKTVLCNEQLAQTKYLTKGGD